ncbi:MULTISPECIES: alpha/beta fold hydrolase [Amycolatopsis]|uniref:Alpha/beta hydrolase n=1 Tax=Amycolatopsis thermalba TaxID=944492 RepID=A0ABY4P1E9_9PSEU|nr:MULTISPECIES: alpha/beta hydrolase [Amycolatopsis]OXM67355.1 alpha/beta hydrolase [Amycolatopsis sp. KNN50.9b]UQS26129.1 alpha/beta hydrolase [Amycolatopsis thermalba]
MIPGLVERTVAVDGSSVHVAHGGAGHPVLLLHGFPQTHLAWRHVAASLAADFHVVCPDLPGYGASAPPPGDDPAAYAKRVTAATMVALMRELGHERFSVVGHDRGALVAFRAALDHPGVIEHLAVLDVIPTVDNWAALHGAGGVFAFHLYLLAQGSGLPERMIGAAPDVFFGHFLDTWTAEPGAIPADVRAAYLAAAGTPAAIHAICQDYRASAFVDAGHDQADRDAGRTLTMPVLAMWQDPGEVVLPFDPRQLWASWAPDLRTRVLPCGHFLPEERPGEVTAAIRDLLGRQ